MSNVADPAGRAEAGAGAGAGGSNQILQVESEEKRLWFFEYITAITRVWSLITCGVLWGCTIKLLQEFQKYQFTPWYLLCITVIFTFFEILWMLNKLACCRDDGGCCCTCWRALLWFDNWKKTVLYVLLSAPCFIKGVRIVLAVVCGLMVIATAVFYLLKSFKDSKCVKRKVRKTQFVDVSSPKAQLVPHEIQTDTTDYPSAATNYQATGEAVPVQPSGDKPKHQSTSEAEPAPQVQSQEGHRSSQEALLQTDGPKKQNE